MYCSYDIEIVVSVDINSNCMDSSNEVCGYCMLSECFCVYWIREITAGFSSLKFDPKKIARNQVIRIFLSRLLIQREGVRHSQNVLLSPQ